MIAHNVQIEWEEDGCWLKIDVEDSGPEELASVLYFKLSDPEQLYDRVKAAIGPWLRERDEARATMPAYFACDPDESGGYDVSDPKHPDYHSIHADIWDMRDGK